MGKFILNKITIRDSVALIELTDYRGNPIANAMVDAEDADRVQIGRWRVAKMGRVTYAAYQHWRKPAFTYLLHRVVLNAQPGQIIDHINGNGLDCRKSNLRFVDRQGNAQNLIAAHTDSKTGVRNVYPSRNGNGTFDVQVSVNGKRTCRCGFRSIEEAAQVASELRRQLQSHSPENSNTERDRMANDYETGEEIKKFFAEAAA